MPLAQVDLLVLEEVLLLGEALWALVALVWPLPCVDPLMSDQIGGVAEGLPTVRAPKDPPAPARVHTPVDDEGFLLGEALLTLVALVRPPPRVAPLTWLTAAVGVDAFHAPGIGVHLVRGWDAGAGFCILVLLEPLRGHVGPVFHAGPPPLLLMEEALLVSSVLTAALCAVALLVSQHLLQTEALPTCSTRVRSLVGTVLPIEGDSVAFAETLFPWSGWHQCAHALVSLLHRRAVLTIKGQRLAGTLEKQLLRLPG